MTGAVFGEILPGVNYVKRPGAYAFIENSEGHLATVRTSVGLFLPGGGVDPGEKLEDGLSRELFEEIGYTLVSASLFAQATQFHWSGFYQQHFEKIGYFYLVTAKAPPVPQNQVDHELLWYSPEDLRAHLSQEFQRWAAGKYLDLP